MPPFEMLELQKKLGNELDRFLLDFCTRHLNVGGRDLYPIIGSVLSSHGALGMVKSCGLDLKSETAREPLREMMRAYQKLAAENGRQIRLCEYESPRPTEENGERASPR